jgi:hypothetical protein
MMPATFAETCAVAPRIRFHVSGRYQDRRDDLQSCRFRLDLGLRDDPLRELDPSRQRVMLVTLAVFSMLVGVLVDVFALLVLVAVSVPVLALRFGSRCTAATPEGEQ